MNEHLELVNAMVERACAGDREAAVFLLQEFVNHVQAIARDVPPSDRVVLEYLRSTLKMILEGVPAAKALGLGEVGGPKRDSALSDFFLFVQVGLALQKCEGRVHLAIRRVAAEKRGNRKVGAATVKKAWNRSGGKDGWKRLIEEKEPT